eukprot:COSAG01_NODE_1106_length_11666_cov_5.510504_5_plen_478_part_00
MRLLMATIISVGTIAVAQRCQDDPNNNVAAAGITCAQLLPLGCALDMSTVDQRLPPKTMVSLLCPRSCNVSSCAAGNLGGAPTASQCSAITSQHVTAGAIAPSDGTFKVGGKCPDCSGGVKVQKGAKVPREGSLCAAAPLPSRLSASLDKFAWFPWPPPGYLLAPSGPMCGEWIGGVTTRAMPNVLGHASSEHFYNFTVGPIAREFTFDSSKSSFAVALSIKSTNLRQHFAGCDGCSCSSNGDGGERGTGTVLRNVLLQPGEYALVIEGAGKRHGRYTVQTSPSLCMSELVDNTCHDDKGGFLAEQPWYPISAHDCISALEQKTYEWMGTIEGGYKHVQHESFHTFGMLTCWSDLSIMYPSAPKGTTLAVLCPEQCSDAELLAQCRDTRACEICPECRYVRQHNMCSTALGKGCCSSCPMSFLSDILSVPHCKYELGKASSNASVPINGATNPTECAADAVATVIFPLAFAIVQTAR